MNGESLGTYVTDVAYHATKQWQEITIDGLELDPAANHDLAIRPTESNAHILIHSISFGDQTVSSNQGVVSSAGRGLGAKGAASIHDDYVKLNTYGQVSFQLGAEEGASSEPVVGESDRQPTEAQAAADMPFLLGEEGVARNIGQGDARGWSDEALLESATDNASEGQDDPAFQAQGNQETAKLENVEAPVNEHDASQPFYLENPLE